MAVSKRLRFEIFRRDGFRCRYCGLTAAETQLRVDHVIPEALAGSDEPENLTTACEPCNSGKTSIPLDAPLVAQIAADAERWARAMQRAAENERRARSDDHKFVADFMCRVVDIINADPDETNYCMPDLGAPGVGGVAGARRSLLRFRDCGLDLDDLENAIRKAGSNRKIGDQDGWKYFCGICWGMIRDRQDAARLLLAEIHDDQEANCGA